MHRCGIIICSLVLVCALCGTALGAEPSRGQDREGDWSLRVGALGTYRPAYEGSDDYELKGFPLIDIRWRDRIFVNTRSGVGAYLWNRGGCKLGLAAGYTFGRDEDASPDLRGMGDIHSGATAALFFEGSVEDIALTARYERQITGHGTGGRLRLGLGYDLRLTEEITVKPSIRTTYASGDYMEEYFGVSPDQSARSGLPAYDADAGFTSLGAAVTMLYRLNNHWGMQATAGCTRLVGDAADSPVVKTKDQYPLSIGLSYSF